MTNRSTHQTSRLVLVALTALLVLATPVAMTGTLSADDVEGGPEGAEIEPIEAGATAIVSVGSATVKPLESDTVQFRIDDVENMGAFTLTVSFDNTVALITGIAAGALSITDSGVAGSNAAGQFSASYFAASPVSGDFLICTLTFQAVGPPGAHSDLTVGVATLVDTSGVPLSYSTVDGDFDIEMVYDFGDAPDPTYPTELGSNGARHGIVPGFLLGTLLDWEDDGQPNASATGDDNAGADDEDGVSFTSRITPERTATVDVTASSVGLLDAWVDFNDDGDWSDTGEQVFSSEALVAGLNSLSFAVPENAVYTASTFARFRFSSAGGLPHDGLADDGEVEDYEAVIEPTPPDPPTGFSATTYSRSAVLLEWSEGVGADTTVVVRKTGSYPTSPVDGTEVYSGDDTSCTDTGLDPSTTYYYAAWSYTSATGLYSDTAAQDTATTLPAQTAWTFMVYMDADNTLEGADDLDLAEMIAAGSTSDVSIVVQQDRYSTPGTWRHYVTGGGLITVETLAEQNMADPLVLADFVDWVTTEYSAQRYALILWDHGSGCLGEPSPDGVIYDDTSVDFLSISELGTALSAERPHLDLLGFDACLMQMYEVAYEMALLSDPPDVVVGSEDLEPFQGWPYDAVLDHLIANPSADAAALGAEIVLEYIAEYAPTMTLTLSAVQPAAAATMADTIDALAAALIASDHQAAVATARANAQAYSGYPYRDMVDFCDLVLASVPDCVTEAQAMKDLVASMVTAEGHTTGTGVDDSHGLAVYLPATPAGYDTDYDSLSLASATWWDDFLRGGYDYGDAPDPSYPTLSASTGARHALGGPWLGATVDAEVEALPDGDALGDDEDGDDEDGVSFLTPLSTGHAAQIEATSSATGLLDAWVDFNGDGDWADGGEQVFSSEPLVAGVNALSFDVPSGLTPTADAFVRFRVSSAGGLAYSGTADDGEVEDYRAAIVRLVEGDATRDHVTNIIDAMFIAQYTVDLREFDANQLICGDTNDDGQVNIVDAMHIAQYTVDPTGAGGVLFKPLWEVSFDPLTDPPA